MTTEDGREDGIKKTKSEVDVRMGGVGPLLAFVANALQIPTLQNHKPSKNPTPKKNKLRSQ